MTPKKDNRKPEREKDKKCYSCKSIFSFNSKDVQLDRDGAYLVCPFCFKFNAV